MPFFAFVVAVAVHREGHLHGGALLELRIDMFLNRRAERLAGLRHLTRNPQALVVEVKQVLVSLCPLDFHEILVRVHLPMICSGRHMHHYDPNDLAAAQQHTLLDLDSVGTVDLTGEMPELRG